MTSIFSFQPRYPIWKQIKEFLKPQEENEVRTILGENMLIRNDIAHQELFPAFKFLYNKKLKYDIEEREISSVLIESLANDKLLIN